MLPPEQQASNPSTVMRRRSLYFSRQKLTSAPAPSICLFSGASRFLDPFLPIRAVFANWPRPSVRWFRNEPFTTSMGLSRRSLLADPRPQSPAGHPPFWGCRSRDYGRPYCGAWGRIANTAGDSVLADFASTVKLCAPPLRSDCPELGLPLPESEPTEAFRRTRCA